MNSLLVTIFLLQRLSMQHLTHQMMQNSNVVSSEKQFVLYPSYTMD